MYFVCSDLEEDKFEQYLPVVVIWCIATTMYPKLSKIIRRNSFTVVIASFLAYHFEHHEFLVKKMEEIRRIRNGSTSKGSAINISGELPTNITISFENLVPSVMETIEYMYNNSQAFYFFRAIAQFYSIYIPEEKVESATNKDKDKVLSTKAAEFESLFRYVVYNAGLVA
jgi:hypothetical protein